MGFDIANRLRHQFELASLKQEAIAILKGTEWESYQTITKKFEEQRAYEQEKYEREYQTRVEAACKRLIDEAGEIFKVHKPRWPGDDRFDKSAINRQAHRVVRDRHQNLMTGIDDFEKRAIGEFLGRCQHRQQQQEKPKQEFTRAADRRNGMDRRMVRQRER